MEVQLKELIEKVKQEGIQKGREEARQILRDAEKEAESKILSARRDAEKIHKQAVEDAAKLKQEAEDSIRISLRDMTLKFRNRIHELFNRVILEEVQANMTTDFLKKVIEDLFGQWQKGDETGVQLKLSRGDHDRLGQFFTSRLSDHLKSGVTVVPDPTLEKGFRISLRDGSLYYDFSARTIAEIISGDLEPAIAELLEKASSEE